MKKILISLVSLAVAGSTMLPVAFAKDMSALKVTISKNVNADCEQPDGYDPIWACYKQELKAGDKAPKPMIFIREGLPDALMPYVFLRQVGEYMVADLSDQELKAVFNPAPDVLATRPIRDIAGNAFAMWVLGGHVSVDQAALFAKLLAK